jgi:hypothetical protein
MLLPKGGWIIKGENFDDITWVDERPRCTKAEYEAGFSQYDAWKSEQDSAKATAKIAAEGKLAALGLTVDDLRALGL